MQDYTLDDFISHGTDIILRAARESEPAAIHVGEGHTAVIIDGGEYEMFQQALKLCEEHPSWLKEKS